MSKKKRIGGRSSKIKKLVKVLKERTKKTKIKRKTIKKKEQVNQKANKQKLNIKNIKWTQDMSVNEAAIDKQHQRLLNQIHKLTKELYDEEEIGIIRETLHFLYKYIQKHLAYEEKYMLKNKYPKFKTHKKIHQGFIKFFNKYHKEFKSVYLSKKETRPALRKLGDKAKKFLGDWWVNHISTIDQKYAKYVKSKKTKKPISKKKKDTGFDMSETKVSEHAQMSKKRGFFEHTQKSKISDESPIFDMSKIKEQIERKLKKGKIKDDQAQILEQRAPAEHVIKKFKDKKKKTKGEKQFVLTNIPGFDELFEKGIPKGSAILIAGGAGSGKTIFALQTLFHHASHGEKCFYMSFEESEEKLIQHMKDLGWDAKNIIKSGKLKIKRMSPFEITRNVDAMLAKEKGELLIELDPVILPKNFKPEIIVLDSLTAIASAFTAKEDSYRIYIEQLFRFFEKLGSTSFLITETKQIPEIFSTTGVEEFLADGVIVFYNIKRGDIRENAIEVLKMRGEKHQKKIVAMQITDNGIVVYPEQEIFGGIGKE